MYQSFKAHHAAMLKPMQELFFFDFDGVLCDSIRETAKAGYLTCLRLWPELASEKTEQSLAATKTPEAVVEGFQKIRPLLTTGWQAVVMIRMLIEAPGSADSVVNDWSDTTCSNCLEQWNVSQQDVMDCFHKTRQQWIKEDLSSWISEHGVFATALSAFRVLHAELPNDTFILTTKSAEFTQVILRSWGIHDFREDRVFGLGSGPKIETIHRIVSEHEADVTKSAGHAADSVRAHGRLVPVRAHFFEDKLSTLVSSAASELSKDIDVRFYFERWGYNTAEQLAKYLAGTPDARIHVHESQHDLINLLRSIRCDAAHLRERKISKDGIPTPNLLRAIAREHGTPTFVYSLPRVAHNLRVLKHAFDAASEAGELYRTHVLYAMKANSHPAILQTLLQHGCSIDAVSPAEVQLALAVGFPPSRILFTANNITDEEMHEVATCTNPASGEPAEVLDRIVFNIGSLSRLRKYAASYPNSNVCIRVNPDVDAGEHRIVKTGTAKCKFGIAIESMPEVAKIVQDHGMHIIGLHQHTGSGISDPAKLTKAVSRMFEAASALYKAGQLEHLRFIDIGGGFKVPYRPDDKPIPLGLLASSIAQLVRGLLDEHPELKHGDLVLNLEPGKFLVADCGHLLLTANTLKERAVVDPDTGHKTHHRIVGTDSGFNHLIRPVLYDAYHQIVNLQSHHQRGGNEDAELDDAEMVFQYDVAGNICESGDLFATERPLRRIREGDLLEVRNAGAYCRSMASEYNMRGFPNEVTVLYSNLQPEHVGDFPTPLVTDTVATAALGAMGHYDSAAVVVRTKLTYKRRTSQELVNKFLSDYGVKSTLDSDVQ